MMWPINFKLILSSKKGESLVEAVISLLIFSIMLTTVTMMITTSLRISRDSTEKAYAVQEEVDKAVLGIFDDNERFTFELVIKDPTAAGDGTVGSVEIPVNLSDESTFTFFAPVR